VSGKPCVSVKIGTGLHQVTYPAIFSAIVFERPLLELRGDSPDVRTVYLGLKVGVGCVYAMGVRASMVYPGRQEVG
jgi:hypothetical protein